MTILRVVAIISTLAGGGLVLAEAHDEYTDKPYFQATQTETVTAEVTAINHETREVSLLRADGAKIDFTVTEAARNLDQVSVGDTVVAQYVETMSVRVMTNEGQAPSRSGTTAVSRAEKGAMPGMTAIDTEVVTATVEEIDIASNTFKLKGPDGVVEQYTAQNPENLKRAEVGDLVVMTFTSAVGVSVEPKPE